MKRITTLLLIVLAIAVSEKAFAGLSEVSNDSLNVTVNFNASGDPNSVTILDNDGVALTTFTANRPAYTCNTNKKVLLIDNDTDGIYMRITASGYYDVSIYTNNLDLDNDSILDYSTTNGEVSDAIVMSNGKKPAVPLSWYGASPTYTKAQRNNWVSGYAGIMHEDFPHFTPLKVWSEGENVGQTLNSAVVGTDITLELEADNETIKASFFEGDAAVFGFIPERLAADIDAEGNPDAITNPIWHAYHKIIAGTLYGSEIKTTAGVVNPLRIAFGVDLLKVGKGNYSGKIYLTLRSN